MMRSAILFWLMTGAAVAGDLEAARDRQDRAALTKMAADLAGAADKAQSDAAAQYRAALASSYLAEVSLELKDKQNAQRAAEAGIQMAERAVALKPSNAEYHRVLGTLCGQVVPASPLAGLSYGKRARDAVAKAIELNPKSSEAYLARGIGNYYLPAALGGGVDLALADFRKAIELDPKSADAYLWLGLSLRKGKSNADARKAFTKALEINPNRVWIKQQLEKTPPQ